MDERRLRIFQCVAELCNFSRAAEVLHLSQPSVSQQIQGLEEYFGVRLFDRTSKTVQLTAAGRTLYAQVEPLLQQHAEVRRAVAGAAGVVSGRLVVGASLTIGEYVLPRAIQPFVLHYPDVDLHVQIENTEQIAHLVSSGALDLGLVEGPVTAGDLVQEAFLEDELIPIAPAGHPWQEKASISLADFLTEPLILREKGSGTRRVMEEALAAAGVNLDRLAVRMELAGTEAIKEAVEIGLGVSVISRWTIRKELRLGSLVAKEITDLPIKRRFWFLYPRGRSLLPAASALMEQLRSSAVMYKGL